MKTNNKFVLKIKSVPDNVAFARVTTAAFASQLDFTLNELEEIKVALSEAVTNSIVHGYENKEDNYIELAVSLTDAGIEMCVKDNGKGIEDISKAMEPAYSTDPERMGLGFVFMQSFMDNFKVESDKDQGVQVVMFKKVSSADGKPEH